MCSSNSSHMYKTYCHVHLHNCDKKLKNNNTDLCDNVSINNSLKLHTHFSESFSLSLLKNITSTEPCQRNGIAIILLQAMIQLKLQFISTSYSATGINNVQNSYNKFFIADLIITFLTVRLAINCWYCVYVYILARATSLLCTVFNQYRWNNIAII
jgi:hypothetical protein